MKRLIRLDASSLEKWACPRAFQFVNRLGLVNKIGSAPLDWGAALHKGIAQWRRGVAEEDCILEACEWYANKMCPKVIPRDGVNLRACLKEYFEEYQDDVIVPLRTKSGTVAVELPFSIPFYSTDTADVMLCGTIDEVSLDRQTGALLFKDIKHSSTNKVDSHLEEQLARPQFAIYAWALAHEGFRRENGGYLPIMIDGVYIDKKITGAKFRRTPATILEPWVVDRTIEYARGVAKQLVELSDEVSWPHNYSMCYGKYSKCDFWGPCQCPTEGQSALIDLMYDRREYNPATFGD